MVGVRGLGRHLRKICECTFSLSPGAAIVLSPLRLMPACHAAFEYLRMVHVDVDSEAATEEPPEGWAEERSLSGRIVVYRNGACVHNQDERLRRAGSGGFWAHEHHLNFGVAVLGSCQTNQRAELLAA